MISLFWRSGEDSGRVFRAGSPAVHYRPPGRAAGAATRRLARPGWRPLRYRRLLPRRLLG